MEFFWPVFLVIFVGLLTITYYWWYAVTRIRNHLNWIPRVPGLPILGNILDFRKSTESWKTMLQYGKTYNGLYYVQLVSRYLIIASDVKFLKFVLSSNDILEKSSDYRFLHQWLGQGLLTSAGSRWRQSRKIITPAFHFSILEKFVDVFDSNAQRMVKLLEKEVDKEFDIFPYVTMYSLDVICESAMGISINAQENRDSEYVFAVKEMCRITVDRAFSPIKMFDFLYPLTRDYYKEKKYVKLLHSRTQAVINSRREQLREEKTEVKNGNEVLGIKKKLAFLDLLLLHGTRDGNTLPDYYIREEVDTFMFEGHDTTAAAIGFTLYCLANHQDVQENVFLEQTRIFENNLDQAETYEHLQNMKYLEQVIKESLRLYPSVPFYAREVIKDTVTEDGNIIPKGVSIDIFAFGVNRDPSVFKNPDEFDPERFGNANTIPTYSYLPFSAGPRNCIDGNIIPKGVSIDIFAFGVNRDPSVFKNPDEFDPERFGNANTIPTYSYLPFSAGPRNCIGQKYAVLEIKSAISKLVRNFKILPTTPRHEVILAAEAILKSVNGLILKISKRI